MTPFSPALVNFEDFKSLVSVVEQHREQRGRQQPGRPDEPYDTAGGKGGGKNGMQHGTTLLSKDGIDG